MRCNEPWHVTQLSVYFIPKNKIGLYLYDVSIVPPDGQSAPNRGRRTPLPAGQSTAVALFHPKVAEKVQPMFMRGDYDIAVFQAFKEVDVSVRGVAKMSNSDIGRKLMHAGFIPVESGHRLLGTV